MKTSYKYSIAAVLLIAVLIASCMGVKNQTTSETSEVVKTDDLVKDKITDAERNVTTIEFVEVVSEGATKRSETEEEKSAPTEELKKPHDGEYLADEIKVVESDVSMIRTKAITCSPSSITLAIGTTTFSFDAGASPTSLSAPAGATPSTISYTMPYTEDMESTDSWELPVSTESSGGAIVDATLAGQLTAGEVNDFKKWKMWEDISEGELQAYRNAWKINPQQRYTTQVLTESGAPVVDCLVELISSAGTPIWKAHTDNTGKAELWGKMTSTDETQKVDRIHITQGTKQFEIKRPKEFDKGINTIKIPVTCDMPQEVDICFTVDATGSMGDEIAYLQAELVDVIGKVKSKHEDIALNLGSVFYRDHGDTYVTRNTPFTKDISKVNQFIAEQYADGGGDGPEAVDDALRASLFDMTWQPKARARLMFLILDAPPHQADASLNTMMTCVREAASKGIRIIPLVASGGGYDVDKSLEYLMRSCALGTNGTYAFLTNHSGIGGNHTAPSTDSYDVETLNQLLLRVIDEYLMVPDCNVQQFVNAQEPQDTVSITMLTEPEIGDSLMASADTSNIVIDPQPQEIMVLKCYPNPATDFIWVQTSDDVKEIFLADNSGKLMQKLTPSASLFQIDLTNYPSGIYYLKAYLRDEWVSTRFIIARLH